MNKDKTITVNLDMSEALWALATALSLGHMTGVAHLRLMKEVLGINNMGELRALQDKISASEGDDIMDELSKAYATKFTDAVRTLSGTFRLNPIEIIEEMNSLIPESFRLSTPPELLKIKELFNLMEELAENAAKDLREGTEKPRNGSPTTSPQMEPSGSTPGVAAGQGSPKPKPAEASLPADLPPEIKDLIDNLRKKNPEMQVKIIGFQLD